jgi:cell division transport system permease protein
MIIYNLTNIVSRFEDEVHIVSYLKDEFESGHENIKKNIENLKGVQKVSYRTKEEALESFKSSLGKNDRFLDDIPGNPLPASFEIRLEKGSQNKNMISNISSSLKTMGIFDDISYGQEWIEHFHNFLNVFKIIGMAIGGGFLLAAVFIISNTIKLTIYARKEEIEILKLVGATDNFIKAPFFIEGIIQGFCGAVISIVALYFLYLAFLTKVQALSFVGISSQNMPFLPVEFLIGVVIFSTVLGMLGCLVSLGEIIKG